MPKLSDFKPHILQRKRIMKELEAYINAAPNQADRNRRKASVFSYSYGGKPVPKGWKRGQP